VGYPNATFECRSATSRPRCVYAEIYNRLAIRLHSSPQGQPQVMLLAPSLWKLQQPEVRCLHRRLLLSPAVTFGNSSAGGVCLLNVEAVVRAVFHREWPKAGEIQLLQLSRVQSSTVDSASGQCTRCLVYLSPRGATSPISYQCPCGRRSVPLE